MKVRNMFTTCLGGKGRNLSSKSDIFRALRKRKAKRRANKNTLCTNPVPVLAVGCQIQPNKGKGDKTKPASTSSNTNWFALIRKNEVYIEIIRIEEFTFDNGARVREGIIGWIIAQYGLNI